MAAAAEKLAECQETIYLLDKQLKGMRPQTDFMGSPLNQKGQTELMRSPLNQKAQTFDEKEHEEVHEDDEEEELTTSSGMNLHMGNESPINLDLHQFSPDSEVNNLLRSPISKHRPTKSGSSSSSSNPTPEKNTRGFSRFFSTKAK